MSVFALPEKNISQAGEKKRAGEWLVRKGGQSLGHGLAYAELLNKEELLEAANLSLNDRIGGHLLPIAKGMKD